MDTVSVPCCDLWTTMQTYISSRGGGIYAACEGEGMTCAASKQVETLILQTLASIDDAGLRYNSNQNLHLVPGNMSAKAVAKILVWAFIGRQSTQPQHGEADPMHTFLQYDTISHQLSFVQPQCAMQQLVYDTMLIISIVTIVAMMLLHMATRISHDRAQTQSRPAALVPGAVPQAAPLAFKSYCYSELACDLTSDEPGARLRLR